MEELRVRKLASAILSFSISAFFQNSPDAGEQRSIDQLRVVVESIKRCQIPPLPASIDMQGFTSIAGPVQNVIWNVELHPSIRGRYLASIEFAEPSALKPPPEDEICTKKAGHVAYCQHVWDISMQIYDRQIAHPYHFRYEFDVTEHGLQFLDAFKKTKQVDDEQWVDADIDADFCAGTAIKSVLRESSALTEGNRPQGIPEEFWSKAIKGDPDAQLAVGDRYAEGISVPQDYAEAYFWLDLAASGKPQMMTPNDVAKFRDNTASHLTNSVLLETQERARKWAEEHPAK